MAEYGDYKKEIKTLGDLRVFVNETLKDIEDDYTFDIDDDFMGIDIILTANCDVSYSEKSFYWTANVNYATDIEKVIDDRIKAKHKLKAFEITIIKEVNIKHFWGELKRLGENFTYEFYSLEWDNYHYTVKEQYTLTQEEFNLLKEVSNEN